MQMLTNWVENAGPAASINIDKGDGRIRRDDMGIKREDVGIKKEVTGGRLAFVGSKHRSIALDADEALDLMDPRSNPDKMMTPLTTGNSKGK